MKAERVVMSGDTVVVEEVEVEEVVMETADTVVRFPRAKVRAPRVLLHNFLPSFLDERAHDLF